MPLPHHTHFSTPSESINNHFLTQQIITKQQTTVNDMSFHSSSEQQGEGEEEEEGYLTFERGNERYFRLSFAEAEVRSGTAMLCTGQPNQCALPARHDVTRC